MREINAAIEEVIDSGAFAGGPFVAQFEKDFAAYCDCPHAIGVGSGTEALWLDPARLWRGAGRRSDHRSEHLHGHG